MIGRYRKLPVQVEAASFDGSRSEAEAIAEWCGGYVRTVEPDRFIILIDTLEGRMFAEADDWVIRGVQGEFYPCKPDIFAATYEEVHQ